MKARKMERYIKSIPDEKKLIKVISRVKATKFIKQFLEKDFAVAVWEYNRKLYEERIVGEIGLEIFPEKKEIVRYVIQQGM